MRTPRRIASVVLLLVILGNVWYISTRTNRTSLGSTPGRPESGLVADHSKPQQQQPAPAGQNHPQSSSEQGSGKDHNNAGNVASSPKAGTPPIMFQELPSGYKKQMDKFTKLLDEMTAVHPKVPPLNQYSRDIKTDSSLIMDGELPMTSTLLGMYLQVDSDSIRQLKEAHAKVVASLPTSLASNAFSGRGIVMTGGGKYFPMVLAALRWLRSVNQRLPVEVYMADASEYESIFCDEAFKELGAKCVVVEDIYGKDLLSKVDSKYALKPLAMLASRFQEFYFMDADSFPLNDPEPLFDIKAYQQTGLVLNGDYWDRYISPHYYEIAGIELGGRARGSPDCNVLMQSDRERAVPGKSSESGQIIFDKLRHFRSLLLTLYYNVYGDDVYFPLLMQGGQGEGDKDTYAAAAVVMGEEFYQTQRRPVTLGYVDENGYKGYAMVQPDPASDYGRFVENTNEPEIFLNLHSNSLKANPRHLLSGYEETSRGLPPLRRVRYYGNLQSQHKETLRPYEDVEIRFFEVMAGVVCDWARERGWVPRDWEGEDLERMCGILVEHIAWLRQDENGQSPSGAVFAIDLPWHEVPRPYQP